MRSGDVGRLRKWRAKLVLRCTICVAPLKLSLTLPSPKAEGPEVWSIIETVESGSEDAGTSIPRLRFGERSRLLTSILMLASVAEEDFVADGVVFDEAELLDAGSGEGFAIGIGWNISSEAHFWRDGQEQFVYEFGVQ